MIHLIYPHRNPPRAPDCIGFELGKRLRGFGYEVAHYDVDEPRRIRPSPGDVLVGHPWLTPFSCMRLSVDHPNWRRRLLLCPFSHNLPDNAFIAPLVRKCDQYLAITGAYWFELSRTSDYAPWHPKMVHLDLAVDRTVFAPLKPRLNPPGQRRFLYIGNDIPPKNTPYLSEIARCVPETRIGWLGSGARPIERLEALGWHDLSKPKGRELVSRFDFLLTVGHHDANPTTVLEAMSWGLIPVCTPQSGYHRMPGIVNVPLNDAAAVATRLRQLQSAPQSELDAMRAHNDEALTRHFHWDRFARQVHDAIESDARPALGHEAPLWRARVLGADLLGRSSWLRPANLLGHGRAQVGRALRKHGLLPRGRAS